MALLVLGSHIVFQLPDENSHINVVSGSVDGHSRRSPMDQMELQPSHTPRRHHARRGTAWAGGAGE
jgi:hypothetical protein